MSDPKTPICNIRLFTGSREKDGATYCLTFVADTQELAMEMCDIHGLTYDGEVVSIIDDNNGGEPTTLYDADGDDTTSFDEHQEGGDA